MNWDTTTLLGLRDLAAKAARAAGELIESRLGTGFEVERKQAGESLASQVVTEVDRASESLLLAALEPSCRQYDIGLLSEERIDDGSRFEKDCFWCIDPLDGTLPFVEGVAGYAVSLALVSREGRSMIGVVYDPRSRTLFDAVRGQGCRIDGKEFRIAERVGDPLALSVFGDRSFVQQAGAEEILSQLCERSEREGTLCTRFEGGAVMNACWALQSGCGCYVKLPKAETGGGSVWDFAATDCLFRESGGLVADMFASPLCFNPIESCFMNRRGVIYSTHRDVFDCIRKTYTKIKP